MSQLGQLVVFSNAVAGREDEFNKWYSAVHVPDTLRVAPEIQSAKRYSLNTIALQQGQSGWQYMTVYEVAAEKLQAVLERMNVAMANGELEMSDAADVTSVTLLYATPI